MGRSSSGLPDKGTPAKLDKAVAENSQMREFLSLTALQTAFTNALQAAKKSDLSNLNLRSGPQPFQGKLRPSQLSAGIDGTTDLRRAVTTARIWGT